MATNDFLSELRFPKDVRIEEIRLITHTAEAFDLRNIYLELNIYEDVFSNVLSGDVVVEDGINLVMNAPLTGQEKLLITFFTPGDENKIVLLMNVYKISERIWNNEKLQTYSLHFSSIELLTSATKKVSKAFQGKHSDIVEQIFNDEDEGLGSIKELFIEPTAFDTQIVVPRWSPLKTINWLADRCVSQDNKTADYLFFETVDRFNFISLSSLTDQNIEPVAEYFYGPNMHHDLGDGNSYAYPHILRDFFTIESYSVKTTFDTLKNIEHGMFASRLLVHDLKNREFDDTQLDYLENFDEREQQHLGEGAFIQRNLNLDEIQYNKLPNSHIHIVPNHVDMFSNGIEDVKQYQQWLLQRQTLMMQYNNICVEINVPGDSRRRVGEIVEIHIPSQQQFHGSEFVEDKYLSGRYLITGIRHIVKEDNYNMVLELSKDSLQTTLPDTT